MCLYGPSCAVQEMARSTPAFLSCFRQGSGFLTGRLLYSLILERKKGWRKETNSKREAAVNTDGGF